MVHNRQMWAWFTAASLFCAAHSAGKICWYLAAAIVAASGAVLLYIMYLAPEGGFAAICPGVLALFTALWTALMAGFAAALAAEAFPAIMAQPFIPLAVLAVSAWSCHNANAVGARVASVLLPLLAAFLALVAGFGIKEVERVFTPIVFDLRAVCVLTLPLSEALLPRGSGKAGGWVFILISAALTAAMALVSEKYGSLHSATMSISILGVMERFEGLLSAAMAAGAVCLCTLLGRAGLALSGKKKSKEAVYWMVAIIGYALSDRQNTTVLLVCSTLFWVISPLLALGIAKWKKIEKRC